MTKSSKPRVERGWDAVSDVVPGDVEAAMAALGVQVVDVQGDEVRAHCPAHVEKTGKADNDPSFSVNVITGLFNCFSCPFSGRFVELAAYMLRCTPGQAVAWIRGQGTVAAVIRAYQQQSQPDHRQPVSEAGLALCVDPPSAELARRGISLEAARTYGILWDDRHGRWITPIRDKAGRLMGWQAKGPGYVRNYPYGVQKSRTLFGYHLAVGQDQVVLVESPLDCAVLITAGIPCPVVSSFGAKVSDVQIALLSNFRKVILWLDNDFAGWSSAKQVADFLRRRGVIVAVVTYDGLPDGCDPGGYRDADGKSTLLAPEQIHYQISRAMPASLIRW